MSQLPSEPESRRQFWVNTLLAVGLGVAMETGGYFLCAGENTSLGMSMFLAVPFVTGFVVAATVRKPYRAIGCCMAVVLLSLSVLLFTGLEGIICIFMASPLIIFGVYAGALFGYFFRDKLIDRLPKQNQTLSLVVLFALLPVLVGAVDRFEKPYRSIEQREVFTTSIDIPLTAQKTWQLLADMEPLDGPQPFLLRMGLPVPLTCTLEAQEVGANRICYFDQGHIDQKITTWDAPYRMDIDITDSTLPGRHWLRFHTAGYRLEEHDGHTKLTRQTTIGTRLSPRWYWRPLERWGVASEHDYVLNNIARWAKKTK